MGMFPSPVYLTFTEMALVSESSLVSSDKCYRFGQASCQLLVGLSLFVSSPIVLESGELTAHTLKTIPGQALIIYSDTVVLTCWCGFGLGHFTLHRQSQGTFDSTSQGK